MFKRRKLKAFSGIYVCFWIISVSFHFTPYIFIYVVLWGGICVWCMAVEGRGLLVGVRSGFFFYFFYFNIWIPGIKLCFQVWQQELLPTEESYWFKIVLSSIFFFLLNVLKLSTISLYKQAQTLVVRLVKVAELLWYPRTGVCSAIL